MADVGEVGTLGANFTDDVQRLIQAEVGVVLFFPQRIDNQNFNTGKLFQLFG